MKFKKLGLLVSIAWIIITIIHGLNYGIGAGFVMGIATLIIILDRIEK